MKHIREYLASQALAEMVARQGDPSPKVELELTEDTPGMTHHEDVKRLRLAIKDEETVVGHVVCTDERVKDVLVEKGVVVVDHNNQVADLRKATQILTTLSVGSRFGPSVTQLLREGPPVVPREPGKRPRTRGNKPSPAQRLLLAQQQRRKK